MDMSFYETFFFSPTILNIPNQFPYLIYRNTYYVDNFLNKFILKDLENRTNAKDEKNKIK
jgi:hypothetical protein